MGVAPSPYAFAVEYWNTAWKALNNKDRQRKAVKSMTVPHRTLICSPQSSKVAPLAPLAPTATEKEA